METTIEDKIYYETNFNEFTTINKDGEIYTIFPFGNYYVDNFPDKCIFADGQIFSKIEIKIGSNCIFGKNTKIGRAHV